MKVLISAYACEPGKGSEPEVGLQIVLAAAREHEVWAITRENNLPALRKYLASHPLGSRTHLIGLDLPQRALRWKRRAGLLGLHWYYDAWQRRLGEVALALDAEIDFDLVHHATFATYWTRTGLAKLDKPLVWGPVGGGAVAPILLMPGLGIRGITEESARLMLRPLAALLTGARRTAKRAAVILCQNSETAKRLGQLTKTDILPNALAVTVDVTHPPAGRHRNRILAAGRLIPWKGYHLLIRALSVLPQDVELDMYGDGPDRQRLERLANRLGQHDRVVFHGRVARRELLAAMAAAAILVHPALHDESPLTLAEAMTLGVPVVALDRAGPPVITALFPDVPTRLVRPSTARRTTKALAIEIAALLGLREQSTSGKPTLSFPDEILTAYEVATSAGG